MQHLQKHAYIYEQLLRTSKRGKYFYFLQCNLRARHQKMESGTRGLKFLMRSLSLINILAVRTKSVCVKFYYSVSICIAFVLWYKKSICVVLLKQLVCTSFSGPARGAKIWGCTIVLPACHAKNSRGFHYLFLLKNWRCTCTLCTPSSASPDFSYTTNNLR